MSSGLGSQYRGVFLLMLCLCLAQSVLAQTVADDAQQKLVLLGVGDGKTSLGHRVSIRFYKASDGTAGRVNFTTFGSLESAKRQTEEWMKTATEIVSREHYDDDSGHEFNDRILAEWKASTDQGDQGATSFLIIRRDRFTCYLIDSPSMQVAKQIEQLIDRAPDKVSSGR